MRWFGDILFCFVFVFVFCSKAFQTVSSATSSPWHSVRLDFGRRGVNQEQSVDHCTWCEVPGIKKKCLLGIFFFFNHTHAVWIFTETIIFIWCAGKLREHWSYGRGALRHGLDNVCGLWTFEIHRKVEALVFLSASVSGQRYAVCPYFAVIYGCLDTKHLFYFCRPFKQITKVSVS